MKHVNLLILTLLSTMFIALPSGAWQLTDVYPDDMNIITSQSLGEYGPELDIWEDYHEDNLTPYFEIPFNSYAIVNQAPDLGCASGTCWFDKIFTKDSYDYGYDPWSFKFYITNSTQWDWTDFHLEFWDDTFTYRLDGMGYVNGIYNGAGFQNVTGDSNSLDYSDGLHVKGQTAIYGFSEIYTDGLPNSFGIRQVATVVPEPISSTLFIVGGAILGFRRFRKKFKK